jgi:CobQ-like glutamine amidotransferase family enzyme
MKIQIIQDSVGVEYQNKYMSFVRGQILDINKELADDLIIMGCAEIYQPSATKIAGKERLHKASVKVRHDN